MTSRDSSTIKLQGSLLVIDECVVLKQMASHHLSAVVPHPWLPHDIEETVVVAFLTFPAPRTWILRAEMRDLDGRRSTFSGAELCTKMVDSMGIKDAILISSVVPARVVEYQMVQSRRGIPFNVHYVDLLDGLLAVDALRKWTESARTARVEPPEEEGTDREQLVCSLVQLSDQLSTEVDRRLTEAEQALEKDARGCMAAISSLCQSSEWQRSLELAETVAKTAVSGPLAWWSSYLVRHLRTKVQGLPVRIELDLEDGDDEELVHSRYASRLRLHRRIIDLLMEASCGR